MPPRGSGAPSAPAGRGGRAARTVAVLVLATLPATSALTACSEPDRVLLDSSTPGATGATSEAAVAGGASASSPASSPEPGSPSGPAATAAGTPRLVLEGDGLGVAVGTSIRHLRFGAARATLVTALTGTLGEPHSTRLTDCGQGARTQLDRQGLSVLIQGTRFVGWTDRGAPGRQLTTGEGIGIGSTLGQVRARYPAIVMTAGSLGPEFTGGHGVSGLLAGSAAASKVTTLYAGETCFAR
jgi:hypothetical protein